MAYKIDVYGLLNRLRKQAQLYEEIDAGTGYGYDKDAKNIREAIQIIRSYETVFAKMNVSIEMRLDEISLMRDDVSRIEMIGNIKHNLKKDLSNIRKDTVGESERDDM